MSKFKIGDTVWRVYAGPTEVTKPCRACAGTKVVTVILGSGEHVQLDCGACQRGFDSPTGIESDYEFKASATPYPVTGVEVTETQDGQKVRYRSGGENAYTSLDEENVFGSYDEAIANGAEVVAKHEAEAEQRMAFKTQDENKSYAWNAAYHLRAAKKALAEHERHARTAVLLKAKAKGGTDD